MYRRIAWNDFVKSRTASVIMLLLITAAAALISLAVTFGVQLFGAIDTLMAQAKTPHFLQMHTGPIDTLRLERFAQTNRDVEAFQVVEFLNMDGADMVIGGNSLAGSVQDNGLCTQSKHFDYLMDLDGEVIRPADGTLYVPVAYGKDGTAQVGEQAIIAGKIFTVAGFLRDSQMNSPLASSKRFLISENDYEAMKDSGTVEYLIEFRLKSLSALGAFEAAYVKAGLEANGPTVTYPLFRMMNAVSDGLMIAVLLMISGLTVIIAFLCIRFTLLAKMEEDTREIGVMKAIGLRISDLKKLYLGKYAAIAAVGSVSGWGISLLLEQAALENIRFAMGNSSNAAAARIWGGFTVLVVFLVVLGYVNRVLNRFKRIPAAQAIRLGFVLEKDAGTTKISLSRNRWASPNVLLGVNDVLARKRLYATLFAVVIAATFIMLVPQNLYSTIASPGFSTYMGIGTCDTLLRLQQSEQVEEQMAELLDGLVGDQNVARYVVHTTKSFQALSSTGIPQPIKVDLGDHTVFPVYYVKGSAPRTENEIALSALNADELGKQIGDSLVLVSKGQERILTVCGIYSDISNGGKTAKASFTENDETVMWYTTYVTWMQDTASDVETAEYAQRYPFAKVANIDSYMTQTFGPTIRSIGRVSVAGMLAALLVTVLVTMLMLKMLIAKESHSIAVIKALGFTSQDVATQFLVRFLLVLFAGILVGTMLANTLGEGLAGKVIASFGAASFQFAVNPVYAYLLSPLALGCAVSIAVLLGTAGVRTVRISGHIKE